MGKILSLFVIFILTFLIIPCSALAVNIEDVKSQLDSIKAMGENYDAGKISYLQLKVYTDIIGEKIRRIISKGSFEAKFGEQEYEGLTRAQIESTFGKPSELTNWVWVRNQERDMKIDSSVPRWETVIFDGKKIKIFFMAHPHIILNEKDNTYIPFYWIGFEVKFKQKFDLDIQAKVKEIKGQAINYYKTGEGKEEFVRNMVDTESYLRNYLDENREKCLEVVQTTTKGEKTESSVIKRRGSLYRSSNFEIIFEINSCEDCEWKWMNYNYWLEPVNREYALEGMKVDMIAKKEVYERMSLEGIYIETEKLLEGIKEGAGLYDEAKTPVFTEWFFRVQAELDVISEVINQKVNNWDLSKEKKERLLRERENFADLLLSKVAKDGKKEFTKQIEFHNRLFIDKITKQESHCEGRYEDCGSKGMRCENINCVPIPEEWCNEGETQWEDCPDGGRRVIRQCSGNRWQEFEGCPERIEQEMQPEVQPEEERLPAEQKPEEPGEEQKNLCYEGACDDGNPCTQDSCEPSTGACTYTSAADGTSCSENKECKTGDCVSIKKEQTSPTGEFLTALITGAQPEPQTKTWEGDMRWEDTCMVQGCRHPDLYCKPEKGWCDCVSGKWNCDGDDWLNGCESDKSCEPCKTDDDCAKARCNPEGWGIESWKCVKGGTWEEEKGGFEFNGGCAFRASGTPDSWFDFNGWGEKFDEIRTEKRKYQAEKGEQWCERELENALIARRELQTSFNQEFTSWLFNDFVEKNPKDFDIHMRALGSAYWSLVDINRKIAQSMQCLHKKDWPEGLTPIKISIDSDYGQIDIWEEWKETDFFGEPMLVLTPYMKSWIFPPKDILKQIIAEEMRAGKIGPEGEAPGPSPAEREEIRQNPEIMKVFNRISNSFGGEGNIIFEVRDGEEVVFKILMRINPDVIFEVKPALDYTGEVDATLTADFDFMYGIISSAEKEARKFHIERPPWDTAPRFDEGFNRAVNDIKMFGGIISGVLTGKVSVSPISAWVPVFSSFQSMFQMMLKSG